MGQYNMCVSMSSANINVRVFPLCWTLLSALCTISAATFTSFFCLSCPVQLLYHHHHPYHVYL